MKRFVFSLVVFIIVGIFSFIYLFPPLRNVLTANNIGAMNTFYETTDKVILTIWDNFYAYFINIGTSSDSLMLKGIIVISSLTLLFVLVIDVISSIVNRISLNSSKREVDRFNKEKEELKKIYEPYDFYSKYNPNDVNFANNKTPYFSLDTSNIDNPKLLEDAKRKIYKKKPVLLIILTTLYFLITLFLLFIRLVYLGNYSLFKNAFISLYSTSWFISFNNSLSNISHYFLSSIENVTFLNIDNGYLSLANVVEAIIYLVIFILLYFVIFLLVKLIKIINKKIKRNKPSIDETEPFSLKVLSLLGDDYNSFTGDINDISKVKPSLSYIKRYQGLEKKASYIDDISQGVEYVGKAVSTPSNIPVSTSRRPFVLEIAPEDLSQNKNITIDDIPSLDDNKKKDDINISPINISYLSEANASKDIDYNSVDISIISNISHNKKANKNKVDDLISFDDDGYAYLVKKGKVDFNEEEDISDVIASKVSKSNLLERYGNLNYSILDNLEPFKLEPFNPQHEIEKAIDNISKQEVEKKIKDIDSELAFKEFTLLDEEEIQNIVKKKEELQKEVDSKLSSLEESNKPEKKEESFTKEIKKDE